MANNSHHDARRHDQASVQDHAPKDEPPAQNDNRDSANHTCAQCDKSGHSAFECVDGKLQCGTTTACPLCNSKEHSLDRCDEIAARVNTEYANLVEDLVQLLVLDRTNSPQVRSMNWTFYDVLLRAVAAGIKTGNEILGYPWSRSFAQKILAAGSDDPILDGKVHPKDFVHGHHHTSDLPEDPLFAGKTILEILEMRNSGQLDDDRLGKTAPFLTNHTAAAPVAGRRTLTDKEADDILARFDDSTPAYRSSRPETHARVDTARTPLTDKEADDILARLGVFAPN